MAHAIEFDLLVPRGIGFEITSLSPDGVTAHEGTGFDPENAKQHAFGSNAARWAIALQQLRDAGDFDALDRARGLVEGFGCVVMQGRGWTTVKSPAPCVRPVGKKRQKQMNAAHKMPVINDVIYDQ